MFCPWKMKPITLCMQEGSHSDITTHISANNPTVLGFRTRPAADDITGNGSQLQTVHRHISFTGKQNEIKTHKNTKRHTNQKHKGKYIKGKNYL